MDDAISSPINIGFNFGIGNNNYSQVLVSTNGYLSFNLSAGDTYVNNLSAVPLSIAPMLAPLWDDLEVSLSGAVSYQVSGSAPNRVFTVEWKNMEWNFNANLGVICFQIKLFETSNKIAFVYKDNGLPVNTASASIGMAGMQANEFYSLDNSSANPTVSQVTETSTINIKPVNGQTYNWDPFELIPVKLLSFLAIKKDNNVELSWKTSAEFNTDRFELEHSIDGLSFSKIHSVSASGNSGTGRSYSATHYFAVDGINYYRLKMFDRDGRFEYSPLARIDHARNGEIRVQYDGNKPRISFYRAKGDYSVEILTGTGQLLKKVAFKSNSISATLDPSLSQFQPGIYYLRLVRREDNSLRVLKIVNP